MILERFAYTPMGVFGRLKFQDKEWFTVEKPWVNNQKNISCIPEGNYTASRYLSPTKGRGEVWQLNNVPNRTNIQIHKGNNEDDVIGCIALGTGLGWVQSENGGRPKWAVTNSRYAMSEFMNVTKHLDEINIMITRFEPKYTGFAEDYNEVN